MRKLLLFYLFIFLTIPLMSLSAQEEYGMASYYGDEFHGGATASGEAYDKNKLTAAHKTLPMGTSVRVTRLDNKKSVVVRINDRGPYLKGRIIDLSGRAASALDMIADGTAEVKLEVLGKSTSKKKTPKVVSNPVVPKTQVPAKKPSPTTPKTSPLPKPADKEPEVVTVKGIEKTKKTGKPVAAKPQEAEIRFSMVTDKNYNEYDLYKIELTRPEKKGFGVQVGSFSEYSNVMTRVAQLQGLWFKNILISIEKGPNGKVYKLILGPFPTQKAAGSYKKNMKKKKRIDGFVVDLKKIKSIK